MGSRHLSYPRSIVLGLTLVAVLFQVSCGTLQVSSLKPGSGGGGTGEDPGGGTGKSSTGATVGIATLVVVGGYLIYRGIKGGPDEGSGNPASEALQVEPSFEPSFASSPNEPTPDPPNSFLQTKTIPSSRYWAKWPGLTGVDYVGLPRLVPPYRWHDGW